MNTQTKPSPRNTAAAHQLVKADPRSPCIVLTGPQTLAIAAGTRFGDQRFDEQTAIPTPPYGFQLGVDYAVVSVDGTPGIVTLLGRPDGGLHLGGFHFAPGGNAPARSGGDEVPAINPHSIWDLNFRPSCPDPRGMTLVSGPHGKFWCDIYLTGADHIEQGTSRFNAKIADGADLPQHPDGGRFKRFDYSAATMVMQYHGKSLLSVEEFFIAAYGVTEKTAVRGDPKVTGLDAPRTSRWGLMQATGNLWAWGHDGDPDEPRASFLGGSWLNAGYAGSRYANVGRWPDYSYENLGARGRGDHLELE